MYERNAIILERYFDQLFGYKMKSNIKTNFTDYCELVDCLEKYKNISEEEDKIMQEYDSIANKIRETQKTQEILNKKNIRYQEERANIFENIDENSTNMQKKLDVINNNIQNIDEQIKENAQQFINIVSEFNEKTQIRTECERSRRNIENQYNRKLNETLDHYKETDLNFERKAKQFIEIDTEPIEKELKQRIEKNGEKEKIPFNADVISKAITLTIYIQKREVDILTNIYEKTNKLFTEIKNNAVKSDRHKKYIKDSKCKLEFIGAIKEYLIQFLDNERLTAVNGEEEHNNLMLEACNHLEEDLEQINNLYNLLLKEMSKKITKKSYSELYDLDYLKALKNKSKEFDEEIKKLKLPVTIINPNYWRIEGMQKIYDVFYTCVTEEYGRDLSEYISIDEKSEPAEEIMDKETKKENKEEQENQEENVERDTKSEIDKKIDMILGFKEEKKTEEKEEDWEDDEIAFWNEIDTEDEKNNTNKRKTLKDDDLEEEDWENDEFEEDEESWEEENEEDFEDNDLEKEEDWEDDNLEEEKEDWEDDDFEDEEDWEDDDFEEKEEDEDGWEDDDFEEKEQDWEDDKLEENKENWENDDFEENEDNWRENNRKETNKRSRKKDWNEEEKEYERWENQFIRTDKKSTAKKKKSFFDKFKK